MKPMKSLVMRQIAVRLPADQVEHLEELARGWTKVEGLRYTRSAVLRRILRALLPRLH